MFGYDDFTVVDGKEIRFPVKMLRTQFSTRYAALGVSPTQVNLFDFLGQFKSDLWAVDKSRVFFFYQ